MIKEFLLETSKYAISAHNSQPFRFQFNGDQIFVFVAGDCHLPAADPTEKDLRASLGALFEAWNIALSSQGKSLKLIQTPPTIAKDDEVYGIFEIQKSIAGQDPLFPMLEKRFSFRGNFPVASDVEPLKPELQKYGFKVLTDKAGKKMTADLYNQMNLDSMLREGYIEELYSWMRFRKSDSRWLKDGLNTDSMALSLIEALGASVVLMPKIFRFLGNLKMAAPLIDETGKIMSASFLVAIPCEMTTPDFDRGRKFLRFWLKLAEMNLFGAPLSLLTDSEDIMHKLKPVYGLSLNETFVNILRVGRLPKNYRRYQPARLSGEELCV